MRGKWSFAVVVLFSIFLIHSASAKRPGVVHVLYSEHNAKRYGYPSTDRGEVQLRTGGFDVRRISDEQLLKLDGVAPDDVIVMCGVYLMKEDAIAALTRFAEQGGGVLWIDAPTPTIVESRAIQKLLGCSSFTVPWIANFAEIETPRPILYKHFITGGHDFFTAYHCAGNSVWSLSTAYELGRFPPMENKEWDVVSRSPVKRPGIVDRIPAITVNMVGRGRVVLFNWKAQHFGGTISFDMIRRAAAWLLADGDEAAANKILAGRTGADKTQASPRLATIEAQGSPADEPLGNPKDFRLPMGIFVRGNNYGMPSAQRPGEGPAQPPPSEPIRDWPMFKKMVANLHRIGAHSVYLGGGMGTTSTTGRDLLQEFCDAMHEQGLAVHTYSGDRGARPGAGGAPGAPRPREGARAMAGIARDLNARDVTTRTTVSLSTLGAPDSPGQIRDIWEFKNTWAQFIDKQTDRDLDGLCVPPDEYHRPVYNGKPGDDAEVLRRFRRQYGFEMPTEKELNDNPQSRAWIRYGYESTAEVFAAWNELVARKKPNIQRTNIIFVGELCWNWISPINWSMVGHASDWSAFMTDPYVGLHADLLDHWYVPETTKRLMSSTPRRQAMVTLQNNRLREFHEQLRPMHVYGEAVSSVAHGGRGVHFFHYFKIFDDGGDPFVGRVENTTEAFSLMRTLDRWGVMDAEVPPQIAMLYNEMGNHYVWLVRKRNYNNGYDSQQAAIDMLLANGHPFELYSLDHPADWAKLPAATRVVIVPFAYSITDKAVAQLEAYAKAGTKVILMQRLGEADENGELRATPALARLIGMPNVVRIDGDIATGSITPDYVAHYLRTIDEALGDARLVNMNRHGNDIEATALDLPGGKKILFALNWEKAPVRFELGINLPKGKYKITERNLKGVQPAAIKGKEVVNAKALRNFAVDLNAEELKFWLIEPAS
ncbi:MAG: hypothetical protein ABFD69_11325 [Candidatus Sumerlaeia bacterium]